ncbi:MAG: hypothetical protein ACD_15C00043G0001, partial [uncultured bacterium]
MKKIVKNLKKAILAVIALICFIYVGKVQAACGTDTVTKNSITYGTVIGADGKCWLDRNLGATRVATAYNDSQSYGWLFQWGRDVDGHQSRTSGTTTILSSSDSPGHANFIRALNSPFNWRSPQNNSLWQGVDGINNPCPSGFRLPTKLEWSAVASAEGISGTVTAFSSALKLTVPGYRASGNGSLYSQGASGWYWASTISGITGAPIFYLDTNSANTTAYPDINRATGASVRCVMDALPEITAIVNTNSVSAITATTAIGNGNIVDIGSGNPERQ